ncbi:MAG: diguanylate cyclase [Desulfovibrio sp.]
MAKERIGPVLISVIVVVIVSLAYLMFQGRLVNDAISHNERQFNDNQFVQVNLAAQAIEDGFNEFLADGLLFSEYSMPEYCAGKRSSDSIKSLFYIELEKQRGCVALVFIPKDTSSCVPISVAVDGVNGQVGLRLAAKWAASNPLRSGEGERYFVQPVHATGDYQLIGAVFPVVDAKKGLLGRLTIVQDLRVALDKYVAPMRSGVFGAGYVLSSDGTIIYDHEEDIIGRNVFDGMHDDYPSLLALDHKLISMDAGKDEYSFTVARNKQTSRKLIAWKAAYVGDQKLAICLSAPDVEIDAALKETKVFQLISSCLLVLVLVLLFYFYVRKDSQRQLKQNEKRLTLAFDGNRDGVWDWDIDAESVYFSQRLKEILGFADEDELDIDYGFGVSAMRVHPDDMGQMQRDMDKHLAGQSEYYENEHRVLCKNGAYKWVLDRGKVVARGNGGTPLRMLGTYTDIEDKKAAEQEIEKLTLAVEHSPASILITDSDGEIEYVNQAFERITGYMRDEVVGQKPNLLKSGNQDEPFYQEMWASLLEGKRWQGELLNRRKDGTTIWMNVSISPLKGASGLVTNYVGVMEDISAMKSQQEELRRLASTDELTGIANRRRFMELATYEYRRALRYKESLCLVAFDIDYFKKVNDTYGHDAGDIVLKELASLIKQTIREIDIVARIGGEEFFLILPGISMTVGLEIADRLREIVERHQFNLGETVLQLTVSFGVSVLFLESPQGVELMIKQADEALYGAKNSGRNCVVPYGPEIANGELPLIAD